MSKFVIGDQVMNVATGETGRVTDNGPQPGLYWVRYGMQRTAKISATKHLTKTT